MPADLELAYLGVEVPNPDDLGRFLADVVGLVPGDDPGTWRNDHKMRRIVVTEGPAADATVVGFEAPTLEAWTATVTRLEDAGYPVVRASTEEAYTRRVDKLACVDAPWGVRVDIVLTLADSEVPFASPVVPGGFLTEGVGFGHVVFATTAFDEAHTFLTEGLGLHQTDWVEAEIGPGFELEIRFYHCNPRHHSVAVAKAPFELPQRLHHFMVEAVDRDDVGRAFDRAWNAGSPIANGLGRHDNDGVFSFYVVSPSGFQVEVGHGGRRVTDPWGDNRRYDRISAWGHQDLREANA